MIYMMSYRTIHELFAWPPAVLSARSACALCSRATAIGHSMAMATEKWKALASRRSAKALKTSQASRQRRCRARAFSSCVAERGD